jgi:Kef-type K+ transport system membrane component KefB
MSLDEASLIGMLFVVFFLAQGLAYLCKLAHVPEFIGPMVAGILLANLWIGSFLPANALGINLLAGASTLNASALTVFFELGLIFLVFTVGLRIRPAAVRAVAGPALGIAMVGVVVPFALGAAFISLAVGESNIYATLFIGTALAASSIGIVSALIHAHGLVGRKEGHLLLAAALFEDITALVLLAIIMALAAHGTSASSDFVIQVGLVIGFAVAFVVGFLFFSEPVARRVVPSKATEAPRSDEAKAGMLVIAILVCLAVGYLAETLQLAAIMGALFAGMALAQVSEGYDLQRSFGALNTLVVPFFFVYIGLLISISGLLSVGLLAVLVTALAIVGKLLAGLVEVRSLGRMPALTIGTGLMARGEVAVIIAATAATAGLLSDNYLGAIVVMAIVTTIVGPILFGVVRRHAPAGEAPPDGPEDSLPPAAVGAPPVREG